MQTFRFFFFVLKRVGELLHSYFGADHHAEASSGQFYEQLKIYACFFTIAVQYDFEKRFLAIFPVQEQGTAKFYAKRKRKGEMKKGHSFCD